MQEFSKIIDTNNLEALPEELVLEPTPSECAAIQKRLQLEGLKNLKAIVSVTKDPNTKIFHLRINLKAQVVQSCVVTLDPVPLDLQETFSLVLKPGPLEDQDFDHLPEILELPKNGLVDVGELIVQDLGLMLPLFPRKSEIKEDMGGTSSYKEDKPLSKKNPFDILKNVDKKSPTPSK